MSEVRVLGAVSSAPEQGLGDGRRSGLQERGGEGGHMAVEKKQK
jgi:hypothetical protein